MKGLTYLLLTTLKNKLLSIKKKPAMLIVYAICIISFVGIIILGLSEENNNGVIPDFADTRILYGIIAGVGLILLYTFVTTGMSTGGTLFTMSDVNLLFLAPISPISILIYGLIKQLGTTLLTSIFIIYQYANLKSNFNISGLGMFSILFIYVATLFLGQLLSIALYIYTNGNPTRKTLIKGVLYFIFIGLAVLLIIKYQRNDNILESLLSVVDSIVFRMIPIAGWAVMFVKAAIEKELLFLIIGLGLFVFASVLIILMITLGEADYYEDVLLSTEASYNKIQEAKEGKISSSNKKVKINDHRIGIGRGNGASSLFYKHLLEMKRSSRFLFVDGYTFFITIGSGLFSYFVKEDYVLYMILIILVYILFFFTIMGKLATELTKPYIYMMPDKSIKKILAASLTNIIKPFFDGVVVFIVVCLITQTSPLLNLFFAIAYGCSAVLFISFTILSQRFLGGQLNKFLVFILEMGLLMVVLAPGIIASFIVAPYLSGSFAVITTLPYSLWCLFISTLIFLLCGNLLDKTELI